MRVNSCQWRSTFGVAILNWVAFRDLPDHHSPEQLKPAAVFVGALSALALKYPLI